jgi:hypothetical protein
MTVAAFPVSITHTMLVDGFREVPPATLVRTQMDVGPAKVRPRSTTGSRMISGAVMVTAEQQETLDAWFTTTLINGALPFTWTHPRTEAAITARFVGEGDDPGISYEPRDSGQVWLVRMKLEILP